MAVSMALTEVVLIGSLSDSKTLQVTLGTEQYTCLFRC